MKKGAKGKRSSIRRKNKMTGGGKSNHVVDLSPIKQIICGMLGETAIAGQSNCHEFGVNVENDRSVETDNQVLEPTGIFNSIITELPNLDQTEKIPFADPGNTPPSKLPKKANRKKYVRKKTLLQIQEESSVYLKRQALAMEEANKIKKRKLNLQLEELKIKRKTLILERRFVSAVEDIVKFIKEK